MINSYRWALRYIFEEICLIFLWSLFSRPKTNHRICIWTRQLILFRRFIQLLRRFFKYRLTCTFLQLISRKCIVFERTWTVSSNLCCYCFFWMKWLMRRPFFIIFSLSEMCSNIIISWSWSFVTLILASICKINFLSDIFKLIFFLRPKLTYLIMVWRWKI